MSKRKREIQKRKKQVEDTEREDVLAAEGSSGDAAGEAVPEHSVTPADDPRPSETPVDDSQIVSAPGPETAGKKPAPKRKKADQQEAEPAEPGSWLGQNKENLLLGVLVLYVLLLGLGTVGELFSAI